MSNPDTKISPLERYLFSATRFIALAAALAASAGIVMCSMVLLGAFEKSTTISYKEIAARLSPSQDGTEGQSTGSGNAGSSYIVPDNLKEIFRGSNRTVLNDWMQELSSDKQRQDFLDNLSAVVAEAPSKDDAKDRDLIVNTYKDLKHRALKQSEFEKYTDIAAKGAAIAAIFGLVGLLLLVSLMLVLLAIERHVRIAAAPNTPAQPIII